MIEAAIDGRIELVVVDPVLDELARVLTLKFGFDPERLREIRVLLIDLAGTPTATPAKTPEAITGDPDDDVILACGAEAEVQLIVSGDRRHLLPVGEYRGIRIITPQALLAENHAAQAA